jgi:hypothetical protein
MYFSGSEYIIYICIIKLSVTRELDAYGRIRSLRNFGYHSNGGTEEITRGGI